MTLLISHLTKQKPGAVVEKIDVPPYEDHWGQEYLKKDGTLGFFVVAMHNYNGLRLSVRKGRGFDHIKKHFSHVTSPVSVSMNLRLDNKGNLVGFGSLTQDKNTLVLFHCPSGHLSDYYVCSYNETGDLCEISHQVPQINFGGFKTDEAFDKPKALRALSEQLGIPAEIDMIATAVMYLTGETPDGEPLTAEYIAEYPLVPAVAE